VERLPGDDLERYYDAVISAIRASLTHTTDAVRLSESIETASTPSATAAAAPPVGTSPLPPTGSGWFPYNPPEGSISATRPRPVGPPMEGSGIRIVGVARLGDRALIAFRWHETGDETYVYTVNLRELADHNFAAGMADTIITTNFFEDVRNGWLPHARLHRVRGLTYVECRALP